MRKIFRKVRIGIKSIRYQPNNLPYKVDYDEYWKNFKAFGPLNSFQKERAEFIANRISSNSTLLDLGSGDGALMNYLQLKNNTIEITVSDNSDYALSHLKLFFKNVIKFDLNDINNYSFNQYDYITGLEVLEHIMAPELLLKSMISKSKKGVFISFPNSGYIFYRLRLLFGRFPLQWRYHPSDHIRFWTKKDLVWWLEKLDFKNYEIHSYEGLPLLNKINSSLFSEAFIIYIKK